MLSESTIEPPLQYGYYDVAMSAYPNGCGYLLTYTDASDASGSAGFGNIRYIRKLATDGTKVGPRHQVLTDVSGGGQASSLVFDDTTGEWMLVNGGKPVRRLDSDGAAICPSLPFKWVYNAKVPARPDVQPTSARQR